MASANSKEKNARRLFQNKKLGASGAWTITQPDVEKKIGNCKWQLVVARSPPEVKEMKKRGRSSLSLSLSALTTTTIGAGGKREKITYLSFKSQQKQVRRVQMFDVSNTTIAPFTINK